MEPRLRGEIVRGLHTIFEGRIVAFVGSIVYFVKKQKHPESLCSKWVIG